MTSEQLVEWALRLEATGLHFARGVSTDGGANLGSLEDVDWGTVIVKIMSLTGWRITDGGNKTVGVDVNGRTFDEWLESDDVGNFEVMGKRDVIARGPLRLE